MLIRTLTSRLRFCSISCFVNTLFANPRVVEILQCKFLLHFVCHRKLLDPVWTLFLLFKRFKGVSLSWYWEIFSVWRWLGTEVNKEVGIRKIKYLPSLFWFLKQVLIFLKSGLLWYNLYAVKFTLFRYEVQWVLTNVFSCVTITTVDRVHLITSKTFWCPIVVNPTASPWQPLIRFLSLLFPEWNKQNMYRIIQYVAFCVWLLLLRITLWDSFLLMHMSTVYSFLLQKYSILFVYPFTSWSTFGLFPAFGSCIKAAINIHEQAFAWTYFFPHVW